MEIFELVDARRDGRGQPAGEECAAVLSSLALTYDQLEFIEPDVFETQREGLPEAKSAAIEERAEEPVGRDDGGED
jgi:hypothetical protein